MEISVSRPYLGNRTVDANMSVGQALGLLVPVGSVHCCLLPPAYQPSVLLGALPGYPVRNLILKRASRLDAFSGYHFRT